MTINSNREFLLLVEATMCNPNGDIDRENRPRIDPVTERILVSDVRAKRDIRDFLKNYEFPIFVDLEGGEAVTASEKILKAFLKHGENYISDEAKKTLQEKFAAENEITSLQRLVNFVKSDERDAGRTSAARRVLEEFAKKYFYDVKLFGATITVKQANSQITGPIQLHWGQSLHPVDLVESRAISTSFKGKDEDRAFSIGRKYQVYYALYAHYGYISSSNAKSTELNEEDVENFRKSLVQGIMNHATGTKLGRLPLVYLEIEYKLEYNGSLGNLLRFIEVETDGRPRTYRDIKKINFAPLRNVLQKVKPNVKKVLWWEHAVFSEAYGEKVCGLDVLEKETVDLLASLTPSKGSGEVGKGVSDQPMRNDGSLSQEEL